MANRVILGDFAGTPRLRCSRPGRNVLDPNLPAIDLALDSAWPGLLQVIEFGAATSANSGSGNWYLLASWPALPFLPIVILFGPQLVSPDNDANLGSYSAGRDVVLSRVQVDRVEIDQPGVNMRYMVLSRKATP
jgi:hypothetical protein